MFIQDDAKNNHLLANLPRQEFDRIRPLLKRVSLKAGKVIHRPGDEFSHVYFPTTVLISLLILAESGMTVAVGSIGNEGLVGIEVFLGDGSTPSMAVVETAGDAYRINAGEFSSKCTSTHSCQQVLLTYASSLINITSQTAACNRFHTIKQRLARLLLESANRLKASGLAMTHAQIASILGSRRESVTLAADELSQSHSIKLARGRITILDRPGLEAAACECYRVVSAEYKRLHRRMRRQSSQMAGSSSVLNSVGQIAAIGP